MTDLHWLPTIPDWRLRLRALGTDSATAWDEAVAMVMDGRIHDAKTMLAILYFDRLRSHATRDLG